ncbi:hypothetical protein MKX03_029663, partial [Papaver bracteatum]
CFFNTVEACVINVMPDESFKFIRCLQNFLDEGKMDESTSSCLERITRKYKKAIQNCYESGLGHKIKIDFSPVAFHS